MGTTFRYIHDDAMFPCDGTCCHFCESETFPVYSYFGTILHPEYAANPELARDEPEISELCAECILGGHVERDINPEIEDTINRFAKDRNEALKSYHKIPNIPFFLQYADWPMCCGDWCEFAGVPISNEESINIPNFWNYWERGPKAWKADYELIPESLHEISLFKCLECEKKYFTWQFT